MISVSVIIPVYNSASFITRCLESLFSQTLDNIEFVFVNDRTPDESMELVEEALSKYPNRRTQVKILEHSCNCGSGAARSSGMKVAKGEYVIHCDSDDWCEINMYEKMYITAKENDADIVCCNFVYEYGTHSLVSKYEYHEEDSSVLQLLKFGVKYSSLWNKLIRRELYDKYQVFPFDGVNMWEDLGVTSRLRYYSKKTIIIDDVFYHYNKLNDKSIVSVPSMRKIEEQMYCAELLNLFFVNATEDYRLVCSYLKFKSKESLFMHKAIRDIKRWKSLYPESHRDIWNYISIPLNIRFLYWLAIIGFDKLAFTLLDSKIILKRIMNKWSQ